MIELLLGVFLLLLYVSTNYDITLYIEMPIVKVISLIIIFYIVKRDKYLGIICTIMYIIINYNSSVYKTNMYYKHVEQFSKFN